MARWDEILSLPVQNPPTLEFSSADMVWSKVEGWRDNIDRVALIPFARVDDFVRGESANKDCPTRFHVEARRRRRPTMAYKPKVDGVLEYILYWCSFGPDDHRKGGVVRPSRNSYVPKKNNAGRPNTKRGCTCHFIVKRLIAEPSVALIIYNEDKHIDKKGLPCHGPQDKKAAGTRAVFAPYISEDLRLRVLSLLHVGVSVETIMQRHNESVERQGGPCNRDDLLTHRYVRRQERSIRRSTYELDSDDSVSVSMWVESHQNNIFFYEDFSDSNPFTLGIQTEWQLQQMIRFGNGSLLVSDSKFGSNKLKYPVHSLLVFNPDNKAIPVAWIISPRFSSLDAYKWMRALYNRVQTKDPSWKLAGFIVDDPLADVYAIRDVFQCSVLISVWRVRHAWHKNLMKKCMGNEIRVEISRRLEQIVASICRGQGTMGLFEDFMEDFVDEADFMDYFKATWYPRIGNWITALQTLPLASQESCAAMEFYHNQLTVRLLNEKKTNVYQRTDWLVDKLNNKVHSYFWLDEYTGKDDFARYRKKEWVSGLTSWRKALKIPDSDVVIEGAKAKVTDQLDRDRVHVVWNPGSQFGICDCNWAEMGNLCEHMLKVKSIWHKKKSAAPSISLLQYHAALMNMLNCPPHDSLIRDHAVSLAVFVQKKINAVIFESSDTSKDQPSFGYEDQQFINERIEGMITRKTNGHDESDRVADEAAGQINELGAFRNGIFTERLAEDIGCAEMDVDPSSICISPPGLHSVDEAVSSSVLSPISEKVLINSESEHLPSNDSNTNCSDNHAQNKCSQQIGEDLDSMSIDIPRSTIDFVEQCTATHQNNAHGDDVKPLVTPPGVYSVDEAVSSSLLSPTRERVLIHLESEHLPSNDNNMNCSENHILNKCSQQIGVDVDSMSIDIPLSTNDFVEQCTVTHQNNAHGDDVKPLISPSSLHSVDEAVSNSVLSPIGEKVLINSESEHLPSNDNQVLNKCSQQIGEDVDSMSIDISLSTVDFVEQCTATPQNNIHGDDAKPLI